MFQFCVSFTYRKDRVLSDSSILLCNTTMKFTMEQFTKCKKGSRGVAVLFL